MGSRLELQTMLEDLLGSSNVYFQPPESIKLQYPCIIYSRSKNVTIFADDLPHHTHKAYQVNVIDKNPDSLIPDKLEALPMCSFDRHYRADNLNHYSYNLFY